MNRSSYTKSAPGTLRQMDGYLAFVPNPLPPRIEPTWELTAGLLSATEALKELAGLMQALPNARLLTGGFVRREAVQSSRIEGTQTDFRGLLDFEVWGEAEVVPADAPEVFNYMVALEHGQERLRTLPLCLRVVREIHARLMDGVRGNSATPGEFRRSQVWIGGRNPSTARYVPPPTDDLMRVLGEWERFLHEPSALPALVRIALTHYQFEAIHPFLDGNGRTGRLLMLLQLCEAGLLPEPILDLSHYIERHRQTYYDLLTAVSETGAWSEWVLFILEACRVQALGVLARTQRLLQLRDEYRAALRGEGHAALGYALVDDLFRSPWVTMSEAVARTGKSFNAVKANVQRLEALGILEEVTGQARSRVYFAPGIVALLDPDTEEGA